MSRRGTTDWERAMIESIEFTNFKALRKTTLPLAPFTLLLGPNGSGKSSVLQAVQGIATLAAGRAGRPRLGANVELVWPSLVSVTAKDRSEVEVAVRLRVRNGLVVAAFQWHPTGQPTTQ